MKPGKPSSGRQPGVVAGKEKAESGGGIRIRELWAGQGVNEGW